MKPMNGKKLTLHRESLRHLDPRDLSRAQGARQAIDRPSIAVCLSADACGGGGGGGGGSNSTCDSDWKCDLLTSVLLCWL